MTLFVAWFLCPLVLAALAIGCGLLVERIAGITPPGVLLPATGLALIIVVAQFFTLDSGLAQVITPLIVALAVVGFGLSLPLVDRGVAWWALAAAVAVFVIYAAPIVFSADGERKETATLQAQFRGVKDKDIEQFRSSGKQVILFPDKLKTGNLISPFEAARK